MINGVHPQHHAAYSQSRSGLLPPALLGDLQRCPRAHLRGDREATGDILERGISVFRLDALWLTKNHSSLNWSRSGRGLYRRSKICSRTKTLGRNLLSLLKGFRGDCYAGWRKRIDLWIRFQSLKGFRGDCYLAQGGWGRCAQEFQSLKGFRGDCYLNPAGGTVEICCFNP